MNNRTSRAHAAMTAAIVEAADVDRLVAILAATPAQSADDRPDDLCSVYVRGPLTNADAHEIAGASARLAELRPCYGAALDERLTWRHSWTRRRVLRGHPGVKIVLSREEWLRENAACILRAGGVEVCAACPATDYERVVSATDADLRAVALASLSGQPERLAQEESAADAWLAERLARPGHTAEQDRSWRAVAAHRLYQARQNFAPLV